MSRYLIEPRDRIFFKGYRFLSSARNTRKSTVKIISKSLSSEYSQKPF